MHLSLNTALVQQVAIFCLSSKIKAIKTSNLSCTLIIAPLIHERIKKMKQGRYNLVRAGEFDVENSNSLRCWPVGQYHKAQHVQLPKDKTLYVKYKNNAIKAQKGSAKKNKTKSGLSLINNVQDDEIMIWQAAPPRF
jgi:hypothetical protein